MGPTANPETKARTQLARPTPLTLIPYMLQHILGVHLDSSLLLNASLYLAALAGLNRMVSGTLARLLRRFFIVSVKVHEDDALYGYVMRWIGDRAGAEAARTGWTGFGRPRSLRAKLGGARAGEDEAGAAGASAAAAAAGGGGAVAAGKAGGGGGDGDAKRAGTPGSYRTEMGRSVIEFQPFEMSQTFVYSGRLFRFTHVLRTVPAALRAMPVARVTGELTLECLALSLAPIERLLEEAQTYYLRKTLSSTAVFRANGHVWSRVTSRPAREIGTVILERGKKEMLLRDVQEYLQPATRRWYANHGIPYRRGYLFSGPPGTGKTSLSAAMAGVFGLDIYVLTLLDPYLTEEGLARLFAGLPSRCIVLMEDVDAAGLKRADEIKRKRLMGEEVPGDGGAQEALPLGRPPKKPSVSISLSGLLNAIDGVSSSEGRILIMTTNKPGDLDSALIRPGRVDVHIAFTLPKREEMREMFMSLFHGLETVVEPVEVTLQEQGLDKQIRKDVDALGEKDDDAPDEEAVDAPGEKDRDSTVPQTICAPPQKEDAKEKLTDPTRDNLGPTSDRDRPSTTPREAVKMAFPTEELEELARRFAEALPEERLSLAAIQGYLLRFKQDPRRAVDGVGEWVRETVREQEGGVDV